MTPFAPPYANLSPDTVLNAVESLGLCCSGSQLGLNSFENRVYQIGMETGPPLVAKFYRPQRWSDAAILEEHAFSLSLAEAELPVVPPLVINGQTLHVFEGYRFSLFPRRGGRAPALDQPGVLMWLGRFLGRIHAIGQTQPYLQRPSVDIQSFGVDSIDFVLNSTLLPPALRAAWESVAQHALDRIRQGFERAGEVVMLRLHGDCHVGNVLWTDAGPHFVDFDDSRMGPAIQDLWMLLSGERPEMQAQLGDILSGYEDFCDFNPRELHLLEPLRTLRLLHYSAWIGRRWHDPAFPVAFPWFGTERYWQDRILELREQISAMEEGPLWVLP